VYSRRFLQGAIFCSIPAMALSLGLPGFARSDTRESNELKYLFVCAGDQARKAPDFLAVLNFGQDSRNYGKVIATANFASPNATGNEPHHIGISSDGRIVGCGGLLSILKGQKEVFFFDVSTRRVRRRCRRQIRLCRQLQMNSMPCLMVDSW